MTNLNLTEFPLEIFTNIFSLSGKSGINFVISSKTFLSIFAGKIMRFFELEKKTVCSGSACALEYHMLCITITDFCGNYDHYSYKNSSIPLIRINRIGQKEIELLSTEKTTRNFIPLSERKFAIFKNVNLKASLIPCDLFRNNPYPKIYG